LDYSYVAYDAELKQAKGMVSATSEAVASQMLANRGWRVLSLKQNRPLLPTFGRLFSSLSRPKTSEIITFSRQLALLIESGIAISRALHLLANQTTDKRLQKVINQVSSDISGGTTISAALAKHPGTFPSMYPKLMAVAEHTGHSEEILRQLADYMERQEAAAAKVRMAMVYPALILVVSIAVVTVLMTVALPPLVGMFKGLGVKLPLTTSILIAVVEFILGNWMLIYGRLGAQPRTPVRLQAAGRLPLLSLLAAQPPEHDHADEHQQQQEEHQGTAEQEQHRPRPGGGLGRRRHSGSRRMCALNTRNR